MSHVGSVAKQLHACMRRLPSFTAGQVQMTDCDWDNMEYVSINVSPSDGYYKGGIYNFEITFPNRYPTLAPTITCNTPIYHPNIDPQSDSNNVCVSLTSDWSPSNTLEDVIQAILFLFYHPNIEDPLSEFVPSDTEHVKFEENIAAIQKGENPLAEELELDEAYFREATVRFDSMGREEWEKATEKTRTEWQEKIGEEKWQEKIKEWEEEQERLAKEKEEREKKEKEEEERWEAEASEEEGEEEDKQKPGTSREGSDEENDKIEEKDSKDSVEEANTENQNVAELVDSTESRVDDAKDDSKEDKGTSNKEMEEAAKCDAEVHEAPTSQLAAAAAEGVDNAQGEEDITQSDAKSSQNDRLNPQTDDEQPKLFACSTDIIEEKDDDSDAELTIEWEQKDADKDNAIDKDMGEDTDAKHEACKEEDESKEGAGSDEHCCSQDTYEGDRLQDEQQVNRSEGDKSACKNNVSSSSGWERRAGRLQRVARAHTMSEIDLQCTSIEKSHGHFVVLIKAASASAAEGSSDDRPELVDNQSLPTAKNDEKEETVKSDDSNRGEDETASSAAENIVDTTEATSEDIVKVSADKDNADRDVPKNEDVMTLNADDDTMDSSDFVFLSQPARSGVKRKLALAVEDLPALKRCHSCVI